MENKMRVKQILGNGKTTFRGLYVEFVLGLYVQWDTKPFLLPK